MMVSDPAKLHNKHPGSAASRATYLCFLTCRLAKGQLPWAGVSQSFLPAARTPGSQHLLPSNIAQRTSVGQVWSQQTFPQPACILATNVLLTKVCQTPNTMPAGRILALRERSCHVGHRQHLFQAITIAVSSQEYLYSFSVCRLHSLCVCVPASHCTGTEVRGPTC